jgi:membrane protease subunit HflC
MKKNKELQTEETVSQVDRHTHIWLKRLGTVGKVVTALLVALVLFWFGFICEVREGNCAVILRFGAVRKEVTQAGVYLKLPWPFETVVTYDNRMQYLESGKLETVTKDPTNVVIQSYVVWRIADPVLYHNSVGIRGTADSFLNEAVKSATNGTLGNYELEQLVSEDADTICIEQIQMEIRDRVAKVCLENYGIEVTDVSILRLTLPDTNLDAVFAQMKADRQKDIDEIISKAQLEASEITLGAAEKSAQIIAQGTTEAAKIKEETEREVAKIYADAQSANIELYKFLMSLDTYLNSVDETTILVVKADEYPFNILTKYSQQMTAVGNDMVVNDLTYLLSQLPEEDRQALIEAIGLLIAQSAAANGVPME